MLTRTAVARAVNVSLFTIISSASGFVLAEENLLDKNKIETIQVTGSHISREGAIAPTPMTVITGDDLVKTGAVNIADALNELPQLSATNTLGNSGTSIGTAGLNTLDLRGMGSNRTLVLVDGKRHVSSVPGSSSVDINTIPTEWVEKVEIITGGASAIYGADAVTGVVNFVLKKRIEGFNASASSGWAEDSGFNNQRFSLSYGSDFDSGRGNAAISAEYAQQSRLDMFEREQTSRSFTSVNNPTKETIKQTVEGGHYRISNGGTTQIGKTWYTFGEDGGVREVNRGDNYDGAYCWGDCDYINLKQWEELQPEFDRATVNFKMNYDVTDSLNTYLEAKYSQSNATTSGQPAFFFLNPITTISRDNAYISDELGVIMDAAGKKSIAVNRFMTDMGPRAEDDKRTTQRYVLGIEGEIADGWDMDTFVVWGQTKQQRTNFNNLIYKNFFDSIDAVKDANGNIVCRDEEARANGCVPTNLFGNGSVTDAARDYISTTTVGDATIEQFVFSSSVSNSALIELPAGYVGLAAGIDYRREESTSEEDPFAAAGNTFFNALQSEGGQFNVKEIFTEVTVPLLADLPLIKQLDVDGAVRYADYSSVGDATSWKLGLNWSVFDDLRIRSTIATAIRAPNIGELYSAQSQNFFRVVDSCKASELDKLSPEQRAIRAANCAALGVAADFDSSYDSATLDGLSGGNPDLKPEESRSVTAGFVYEPSYIDNLTFMVDYWQIEITDAISSIGAQDIIDRCVDSASGIDNQYCALITREKDNEKTKGEITNIVQIAQNIAKSQTSGVDMQIGYDFPLLGGDFKTNLLATYLIESKVYAFQDEPGSSYEYAGVLGDPKWEGQLRLNYTIDAWQLNWKTTYIDRVSRYTDQFNADYPVPYSDIMEFGAYAVTDLFGSYTFDNGLAIGLGIDNLFNRDLPSIMTGNGGGQGAYDNIGRFWYLTLDYKI